LHFGEQATIGFSSQRILVENRRTGHNVRNESLIIPIENIGVFLEVIVLNPARSTPFYRQCAAQRRTSLLCAVSLYFAGLPAFAHAAVCATVQVQVRQEATVTRQGFEASLGIANENDVDDMENIQVRLLVGASPVDVSGRQNDRFQGWNTPTVEPPEGWTVVTDPDDPNEGLVAGGMIAANGGKARVVWNLLPTDLAAPAAPTVYFVGGEISWDQGGQHHYKRFSPDLIQVTPNPNIEAIYFHERFADGDDPLTRFREPIRPYHLAVMMMNTGPGAAREVRFESTAPRIEANLQGLLVGFVTKGVTIDDKAYTPLAGFGTNLGSLEPFARSAAEHRLPA